MEKENPQFRIVPVDSANAHHVGTVFRSIYGEGFPVKDVYQPDVLVREIESGRLLSGLALDEAGIPAGYISMFKVAPNPLLWEAGNVVVAPAYGQTDVSSHLVRYCFGMITDRRVEADGVFSEAVCCHYFSQLHTSKLGMVDCGIELDQLDGASFRDGKSNKAQTERVSCVLNFLEVTTPSQPEYVPDLYDEIIRRLAAPLKPRVFLKSTGGLPVEGVTGKTEAYYASARTWKVGISTVGADWAEVVREILGEAQKREVVSLQVTINTACPHIDSAVAALRENGFFFGGLVPRWFGTDGLLMQKLFGSRTDYDETKLYSSTAKELLAFIRSDREAVSG